MQRAAVFDATGRYRYCLSRVWDPDLPRLVWVMLNPSSADSELDDPTIRRCVGFARSWGFGSMEVVNLFGFRAASPRELFSASDPIGSGNDRVVREAVEGAQVAVAGWGNWGRVADRGAQFLAGVRRDVYCLGLTKHDQPVHPLYQASHRQLRLLHQPEAQTLEGTRVARPPARMHQVGAVCRSTDICNTPLQSAESEPADWSNFLTEPGTYGTDGLLSSMVIW
jgi:hypothetical protein